MSGLEVASIVSDKPRSGSAEVAGSKSDEPQAGNLEAAGSESNEPRAGNPVVTGNDSGKPWMGTWRQQVLVMLGPKDRKPHRRMTRRPTLEVTQLSKAGRRTSEEDGQVAGVGPESWEGPQGDIGRGGLHGLK